MSDGARIAYGRVSTRDQHPEAQRDALIAAGCDPDHMFIEKASTRLETRPKLEEALAYLRPGDTLVVTKLDRLGRGVRDLIDLVARIEKLGVDFVVLHQNIDTSTPAGKMFFHILAAFAEFERDMISERTRDGLKAARINKGHVGGGQRKLSDRQVQTLFKMYDAMVPVNGDKPGPGEKPRVRPQHTIAQIAEALGVARSTVHDYLRERPQDPDRPGRPRGRKGAGPPKLNPERAAVLYAMYDAKVPAPGQEGDAEPEMVPQYTIIEIAEVMGIHRETVRRYIERRLEAEEQKGARAPRRQREEVSVG